MCTKAIVLGTWVLWLFAAVAPLYAQRGTGDSVGVARQASKPEIVALTGTVKSIEVGPCELTTGGGKVGTHLILQQTADNQTLNVHLGPAAVMDSFTKKLKVGSSVTAKAFHTDKMAANHYVATRLEFDNQSVQIRDDSLRPIWSGGARSESGMSAAGEDDGSRAYGRQARRMDRGFGWRRYR